MTNQTRNTVANFDPFSLVPLFRRARHLNSWLLAFPICIILISSLIVACAIDSTLGSWHNFQAWTDFKRALNTPHIPSAQPYFPLTRDVTTWFLAFVVISMCGLAHRQWQLIARCLSDLAENGVLRPKSELKKTSFTQVLKFDHFIGTDKGPDTFNAFVNGFAQVAAAKMAKWAPYIAASSAVIVILLIIGEKHTLFVVFAPHGLDSSRRSSWLSAAYGNWWASDDHPLALLVYFMACFFGAFILIIENIIGFMVVYIITGLPYLAEFDVDWLNRDGNFGWTPVKRIYRTVYTLLTLHGCTISILLIVLGIQNFPWIIILVALWIVVIPLYVIIPAIIFGRMVDRARVRRSNELTRIANHGEPLTRQNIHEFRTLLLEMERVRRAKIRPTYPGWSQTPPFVVAIFLPIVLTIAQILFSGKILFP